MDMITLVFPSTGKLKHIQGQLGNGKSDLASHLDVLASEQYVQDRIIYKLSSQFRSEKSLNHLKQVFHTSLSLHTGNEFVCTVNKLGRHQQ